MTDLLHDLTTLTCDLVRFPTTADRPDQLKAVIDYVEAYLADIDGLTIERTNSDNKPALMVALQATKRPALMLNGHLDVVMARPDQYEPQIRDGRIYGRGTQDMKASMAVMLRLIRDLAARPERPNVGFQFVTDEEIGGIHGTNYLLEQGWECDFMLCLEPTDLGILYEHKGGVQIDIRIPGAPGHASRPWDSSNPTWEVAAGLQRLAAMHPIPAGSHEWKTTFTPTSLHIGTASRNQVPPEAVIGFDIRRTRDLSPEQIRDDIAACFPTAEFLTFRYGPGLVTDPEQEDVVRVADIVSRRTGTTARFYREHYGTDARFYTAKGMPAICLGPIGAGLHSDEEWVDIASMGTLYDIILDFIDGKS
jgi:succinyl-diaminopimelate desuccinylase